MSISPDMIVAYTGSPHETQGLKGLCQEWGYWGFEATRAALSQEEYSLLYACGGAAASPWRGAILCHHSPFSTDVIYLYVSESHRRLGIGWQLLETLGARLKGACQQESLFLEVRPSNLPALSLYQRWGMEILSRRKSYYQDGEDALVLAKELH